MTDHSKTIMSGIRDNHSRGSVADFLREKVSAGSELSVVSAYFTIHAYQALREKLDPVQRVRFLFGEGRVPSSGVASDGHHDAGLAGLVRQPRLAFRR